MNKKFLHFTFFTALTTALTTLNIANVNAQSENPTDSTAVQAKEIATEANERSTKNEERVAKVENILSKLPKISGFINGRYQYSKTDDADPTNSFDVRRVRLNVKGNIGKKVSYRFQAEYETSVKVLDAYFEWKPSPYINVQFGQFKLPITIENPLSPTTLQISENAIVISKLSSYNDLTGVKSNGRDAGLAIYGGFIPKEGFNIIDYKFGIFNGNGINTKDNNRNKDFAGYIDVNPTKELKIRFSNLDGKYDVDSVAKKRFRVGAGILFEHKRVLLRGEYLYGITDETKSQGGYLLAGVQIIPQLQLVGQYDTFENNIKGTSGTQKGITNRYTVGLNYDPIKHIRLQANYAFQDAALNSHTINLQTFISF